MDFKSLLLSFKPHLSQTSVAEKLRSGLAGGIAILMLMLALNYLPQAGFPLYIVASMAASVTLLYATLHSPMTQPWNLVGGQSSRLAPDCYAACSSRNRRSLRVPQSALRSC